MPQQHLESEPPPAANVKSVAFSRRPGASDCSTSGCRVSIHATQSKGIKRSIFIKFSTFTAFCQSILFCLPSFPPRNRHETTCACNALVLIARPIGTCQRDDTSHPVTPATVHGFSMHLGNTHALPMLRKSPWRTFSHVKWKIVMTNGAMAV